LVFILEQKADEKDLNSTILLTTRDKKSFLVLVEATYDDRLDLDWEGRYLYGKIGFVLFHLILVKLLVQCSIQ
jgi:hypothetical protein